MGHGHVRSCHVSVIPPSPALRQVRSRRPALRVTTPKPTDELRGLVYGVGGVNLSGDAITGDAVWYRSPVLLGSIALVLSVLFYLPWL